MQFYFLQDDDGAWGWQWKSGDDIVAVNGLSYSDLKSAQQAVEQLMRRVDSAELPPPLNP